MPSLRTMKDTFGRSITYLRVSLTDRCDLRCFYCMPESMDFLERKELLSFEELDQVCTTFIERGVTKLRLTGGEPFVRKGIMTLIENLARHLKTGALRELTLTTNGTQLSPYAQDLKALGVKRINVSLDTLDRNKFIAITRRDRLTQVLAGLEAAAKAGLKVKINTVALKGFNENDLSAMVRWCGERKFDLTLIETMPLGDIGGDRTAHYLNLEGVRTRLAQDWTLIPTTATTGGPANYVEVRESGQKLGFITPMSNHFCDTCNRMRLTCTGTLYMCLGQNASVNLRDALRADASLGKLNAAIDQALALKPKGHDFVIAPGASGPTLKRHMNVTGG